MAHCGLNTRPSCGEVIPWRVHSRVLKHCVLSCSLHYNKLQVYIKGDPCADSCLVGDADTTDDVLVETTVFELAGEDCAGLLADVTHLLTTNGCNVRSAAVRPLLNRIVRTFALVTAAAAMSLPLQRSSPGQRHL